MRSLLLPFHLGRAFRFTCVIWSVALMYVGVHHPEHSVIQLGNNLSFLTITTLLVYTLGNYDITLMHRKRYLLFFPLLVISTFIFHWCGQQSSLRNNLSNTQDWDMIAQFTYASSLSILGVVMLMHTYYTHRHYPHLLGTYLAAQMFPLLLVSALYAMTLTHQYRAKVHVHHWWLAWYASFFTRYEWPCSRFFAPILLGVYVEGVMEASHIDLFILDP